MERAQQYLVQHLPTALRASPPRILEQSANTIIVQQTVHADLLQNNGQLDCASYTALACLAMQLAHLDAPNFAVQTFNTNLSHQVIGAHITLQATTLRRGRTLIFGDVKAHDDKGKLLAHSTCTFSL